MISPALGFSSLRIRIPSGPELRFRIRACGRRERGPDVLLRPDPTHRTLDLGIVYYLIYVSPVPWDPRWAAWRWTP
jgi:hypothetical protein